MSLLVDTHTLRLPRLSWPLDREPTPTTGRHHLGRPDAIPARRLLPRRILGAATRHNNPIGGLTVAQILADHTRADELDGGAR